MVFDHKEVAEPFARSAAISATAGAGADAPQHNSTESSCVNRAAATEQDKFCRDGAGCSFDGIVLIVNGLTRARRLGWAQYAPQ